jgi:curli biogenesis system outer membrane secretion channel CsgG
MELSLNKKSDFGQEESTKLRSRREGSSLIEVEGQIKSYEVLKVQRDPDDSAHYMAEVKAQVYRLSDSSSSNRKRLAILPIEANIPFHGFYDYSELSDLQRWLDAALENYLVQTRKFMVLSRTDLTEVVSEWAVMNSSATPLSEKLKIGKLKGADYLVLPELLEAQSTNDLQHFQATGQTVRHSETKLSVNIKVVSVITGEIKLSKSITRLTDKPQSERDLLDEMALMLVDRLVQQIYPSLIVSMQKDGLYVFNAGGDAIKVGDHYAVFQEGEEITDPYTGEVIGNSESLVGSLEVTYVSDKFSYGRSIDGSQFGVGMVLRPSAENQASEEAVSGAPKTKGVNLPF